MAETGGLIQDKGAAPTPQATLLTGTGCADTHSLRPTSPCWGGRGKLWFFCWPTVNTDKQGPLGPVLGVHWHRMSFTRISEFAHMLPLEAVGPSSFAGSYENSKSPQEFSQDLTTLAWVITVTLLWSQGEVSSTWRHVVRVLRVVLTLLMIILGLEFFLGPGSLFLGVINPS